MMKSDNLKISLFVTAVFFAVSALAQPYDCSDGRFREFDKYQVEALATDVKYSDTKNRDGNPQSLYLDVFGPSGDGLAQRPLVLVFHGGSFMSGSRQDVEASARMFASLGYVTSTVSYRLGINILDGILGTLDSAVAAEAVAMATQDINTAVRWFRKGAAEDGNPYNINPEMIFAIGFSAGAFMCNFSQYMNTEERIPDLIDMTKPGLADGGISSNSTDRDDYSFELKAVASYAGAIYDTLWMDENSTPNAMFHAVDDDVVPYSHDVISVLEIPLLHVHGGYSMQLRASHAGMKHCWHQWQGDEGGGHINLTPQGEAVSANITRNLFGHFVCGVVLECDGSAPMPTELDPSMTALDQESAEKPVRLIGIYHAGDRSLSVDLGRFANSHAEVTVYGPDGKIMHAARVNLGIYTFHPEDLCPGAYLIRVSNGIRSETVKVVVK
ncbi:carboxylesterase family protein [Fibrobacterota bacterium]